MAFDAESLSTPEAYWLGIKPSDWFKHSINTDQCVDSSLSDMTRCLGMLKRDVSYKMRREIQYLIHSTRKCEIQAVSNLDALLREKISDQDA